MLTTTAPTATHGRTGITVGTAPGKTLKREHGSHLGGSRHLTSPAAHSINFPDWHLVSVPDPRTLDGAGTRELN